MTLQTLKGGMYLPGVIAGWYANIPAMTEYTLSDTAHKIAMVVEVPKSGTLDQFEFRLKTVTQAPGNGLKCSFQDLQTTSGAPDGTADQYRTVSAGLSADAWIAPGLITSDGSDTGTKRSVTVGQLLVCVIEFASFTAGDSLGIACCDFTGSASAMSVGTSYLSQYTSSWSIKTEGLIVALKYNDGTYEYITPDVIPALAINAVAFASNSDPKERGLYFSFPFPCKVSGAWFRADLDGDCDLVLYGSDGTTELASVSMDKDNKASSAATNFVRRFAPVTLAANTNYRLVLQPTSTTQLTLFDIDVNAAAIMDALPGGQSCQYTQKSAADAWTQTATKRPLMGLLITAVDDAVADFPDVGNVTEDDTVNGSQGTYHEATEAEVQQGVTFGADSELTGTYVGGGGGGGTNSGVMRGMAGHL